EDPSCGLALTDLMAPEWQTQVPVGLTAFGWRDLLSWVRQRYGITAGWLNEAKLPSFLHPADELRLCYRARSDLQRLAPNAFTDEADANRLLQSVRQEGTEPSGLGATDLIARTGVNVLAHFCYPSGLQEAARS